MKFWVGASSVSGPRLTGWHGSSSAAHPIHPACWRPLPTLCLMLLVAMMGQLRAEELDLVAGEDQAFQRAAQHVAPSIVQIQPLGGLERVDNRLNTSGPTTGLIVDPDGWIVTSQYGVSGSPAGILVTLHDGQRLSARQVATDYNCELVLLKVDPPRPLPVPTAADPGQVQVGQWAIGVGRTFSAERVNLAVGILSARGRGWGRAWQTDAKISPANYGGPLVDIHGRVLGVLTPLDAPFGEGEGGLVWYDSGIGFAIPLTTIQENLTRWQAGEDLRPGRLGVILEGRDLYGSPATIQQCLPLSPASAAGLQSGDTIVAINDIPVRTQTQLKQQLDPMYAGESVNLQVRRGGQQLQLDLQLVETIPPYARPWLGILPGRSVESDGQTDQPTANSGVEVRSVLPSSPAAAAGLLVGDRITQLEQLATPTAQRLRDAVIARQPQETVGVSLLRDGQPLLLEVVLSETANELPPELPAVLPPVEPIEQAGAMEELGRQVFKLPEEAQQCMVYLPPSIHSNFPPGLLVVITRPGEYNEEKLQAAWQGICDQRHLILAAPKPTESSGWSRNDLGFLQKAIPAIMERYRVDPSRVACLGYEVGGRAALFMALALPDAIRGVVAIHAGLPPRLGVPAHLPQQPLSVVLAVAAQAEQLPAIDAAQERFDEARYPTTRWGIQDAQQLSDDERSAVGNWLDSLDRI